MTDRTLNAAVDLDALDFNKSGGLIPIVAQNGLTGEVLMLGYANREALEATLRTGVLHFWSRSRAALWREGETSGNTLRLRRWHADGDAESVRAIVEPTALTIPIVERPRRDPSLSAASVSAVSPDWLIASKRVPSSIAGLRYRNSEAYSTLAGIRAISSSMYSPTRPACQLVPQAVTTTRCTRPRSN